jgi:hypothetical protein
MQHSSMDSCAASARSIDSTLTTGTESTTHMSHRLRGQKQRKKQASLLQLSASNSGTDHENGHIMSGASPEVVNINHNSSIHSPLQHQTQQLPIPRTPPRQFSHAVISRAAADTSKTPPRQEWKQAVGIVSRQATAAGYFQNPASSRMEAGGWNSVTTGDGG